MTARRPILGILAALGLAVSALSLGGPATAAPPHHETIVEEYAFTAVDVCGVEGLEVEVMGTAVIDQTIKRGPDGLDYFLEHVTIDETHTANGVTTRYTERTLSKDHKLSFDVETGLLDIVVLATGNSTLYGPDGKAIARGPGQVRFHIIYDVVHDVDLLFELVKGSTGRNDDFCAAEMPLFT
jgi:hypothetical protein